MLSCALFLAACSGGSSSSGTAVPPVDQNSKDDVSCNNTGVDASPYMSMTGIVNGQKLGQNNPISSRVVLVYSEVGAKQAEICTGSLLPGNVVLTAGHCITTASKMMIFFNNNYHCIDGSNFREFGRYVTEIVVNPGYDGTTSTSDDDLAMLHFSGDLYPGFMTFDFPRADFQTSLTDSLVMAGYGRTGFTNTESGGVLRITKLPAANMKPNGRGSLIINQVATGICQGDSGSGLIVYKDSKLNLIGVASTVSPLPGKSTTTACSGVSSFVSLQTVSHQSWLAQTYDQLRDKKVDP